MDDLVAIAKIARPRGLRGELSADVLTDFPDRFDGLKKVTAVLPNGECRSLELENAWFQKDRVILKFSGFDTIEAAEALRDAEICVNETDAVQLGEGEFFDWQIEGCRVETLEGEAIGTVRELLRTGSAEILVIDGVEKEVLVPFAEAICVEVDIEGKRIVIDPPEGLLEF